MLARVLQHVLRMAFTKKKNMPEDFVTEIQFLTDAVMAKNSTVIKHRTESIKLQLQQVIEQIKKL